MAPRCVPRATLRDYMAIARFDHMTKHVFIFPGIILAYAVHQGEMQLSIERSVFGLVSAILIASANYVINEWLDRASDAFHPVKSQRTAVNRALSPACLSILNMRSCCKSDFCSRYHLGTCSSSRRLRSRFRE